MMTLSKRLRSLAYQRSACGMDSELEVLCAERMEELEARLSRLRGALEKIANTDYRGNRSTESQIARKALEDDQ